jgi:hypothetical protein
MVAAAAVFCAVFGRVASAADTRGTARADVALFLQKL